MALVRYVRANSFNHCWSRHRKSRPIAMNLCNRCNRRRSKRICSLASIMCGNTIETKTAFRFSGSGSTGRSLGRFFRKNRGSLGLSFWMLAWGLNPIFLYKFIKSATVSTVSDKRRSGRIVTANHIGSAVLAMQIASIAALSQFFIDLYYKIIIASVLQAYNIKYRTLLFVTPFDQIHLSLNRMRGNSTYRRAP